MMPNDPEIETFWKAYVSTLPEKHSHRRLDTPPAWSFGNSSEMADELGVLVLHGTKTATCSLLWEHETDGLPLPQVGELSIILDGVGLPLCLIETVGVEVKPFGAVDASFAAAEGEGDRSLEYWREGHRRYFLPYCKSIGRPFDENTPLVCERFKLVYKV
jgi:uncharacterized protein YhfF